MALNTIEQRKNRPTWNKNYLWRPCFLTDRDEMSNFYRWPSVDASYQVSVHLVKWLQRRFSGNRPTRNKNCLWRPCLLTDRDEISIFIDWRSIDVSYQVSVHLVKSLQRNWPQRNKNCIWRPCLLAYWDEMRNLYRGPPIDALVHLDKRFQRRRLKCENLTDDGRQAMSKAHIAFGKIT